MTGKELCGSVGTGEPIVFQGQLGWIRVYCEECDREYDIREVDNETKHPTAVHVARFDCPNGHHCEARRVWHSYDDGFQKACGIAGQCEETYEGDKQHNRDGTTSNCYQGETPGERESRLALAACLNADMIFRGVKDGLCYFEVFFTDDPDGPKAVLSLPTDGLTAEKIAKHAAEAEATAEPELGEWRCPNGHDSSIPPRLPELIFKACQHYRPTVATWNEFCITCGVRHAAFRIYWRGQEARYGSRVQNPKNYCGYCGAKMVSGKASR